MAVKKKMDVQEVTLKKEYEGLTNLIAGCQVINFSARKATVSSDMAEKIKEFIEAVV